MSRSNFIVLLLLIFSCNPSSKEKQAKDSIQSITDSLEKAAIEALEKDLSLHQENLDKNWQLGTFNDEYGEPTKDKYIQTSVEGTFSNSATSNSPLFVDFLLDKNSIGIFLHEYNKSHSPEKFIGTAKIKMKNLDQKEIEVFTNSEWNQNGGILIKNFTMVKGAESYDYSKVKKFIKNSSGLIKVIIYDKYSSTYRFDIDTEGFDEEFKLL